VAGDVEGHQALQEDLGDFVVGEESVSVDIIKFTGVWDWTSGAFEEVVVGCW
jgi:hypothetical protein